MSSRGDVYGGFAFRNAWEVTLIAVARSCTSFLRLR